MRWAVCGVQFGTDPCFATIHVRLHAKQKFKRCAPIGNFVTVVLYSCVTYYDCPALPLHSGLLQYTIVFIIIIFERHWAIVAADSSL